MSECWIFTGGTDAHGYGMVSRRSYGDGRAHRAVFLAIYGWLPPVVMHRCDTPACYRPDHLLAGTHTANNADMVTKRRHWRHRQTHCKHGHEFTPENTYVKTSGSRECRTCAKAYKADWNRQRLLGSL